MEDLLFLAHRMPYPPNKGDKIRSWNLFSYLSRSYRMHLGAFVDDPADLQYANKLAAMCASIRLLPIKPAMRRLRSLTGLGRNMALSIPYYYQTRMQAWVDDCLENSELKRIFVYSSPMAQYVMGPRAALCRRVIDFVDVDSDKWSQYALHKHWPAS
jgi:hypothetical protein